MMKDAIINWRTSWTCRTGPLLLPRKIEEKEQADTYVEAKNYILNSYEPDGMVANSGLEMKLLRKLSLQAAVQFSKTLQDKAVRWGDASSEKQMKRIFMKEQFQNLCISMQMYREARFTMHLRLLAQYTDTIIHLNHPDTKAERKSTLLWHKMGYRQPERRRTHWAATKETL